MMNKVCKKKKKIKRVSEENNLAEVLNNNNKKLKMKKKKKKKTKKMKKVIMMKKKIKTSDDHGSIAIKKNARKFKLQNHVSVAKRLRNRFAMDIINSDSECGKKTTGKLSSTQDKQKVVEPSRLIEGNQELTPPIRSILKNHTTNCELKSTIHSLQHGSDATPCGIQPSERHVRFSEKDDILGPRKKDFCSPEQNVGNLLSDAVAAASEGAPPTANNKAVAMDVNRSEDDTSTGTDDGTEVQPVIGREQLADIPHVELPSSPRLPITVQDYMRVFQEKSTVPSSRDSFYDHNLHVLDESYQAAALKPAFTGIPRLFSNIGGSCENTQVGGSVSRSSNCNERLINHVQDPYHGISEITPMESTRRLSEPLSCFIENENEYHRLRFQSQPVEEIANDPSLCYRPFCHPYPMDLIGGLCSFPPEWKQKAVVLRERSMDGDFFGLPLNSQGELIQASSRGKGMYNDLRETNIIGPSSSCFPAHNLTQPSPRSTADYLGVSNQHFAEREFPNDRVNLFLAQDYARENPSIQVPARLGVTYWEGTGRADIHQIDFERRSNRSLRPLDADLNLMNISFDGRKTYGQMQNQKMSGIIHPKENSGKTSMNSSQPTMRLMGKDVAIGKSSKEMQGFEDGKVWTDKEIVVEHCQSGTGMGNSSFFQEWIPQIALGKYKETVPQSLEIHSEKPAQNRLLIRAPGSSFSHSFHDLQTDDTFQKRSFASSRSHSPNLLPVAHLPTSPTIFDAEPHFRDFFISGAEPLRLSSQLPILSTSCDPCEHVDWRPGELTHRQNLPHVSKAGIDFPFLNPDSRADHVQSPWFQNSKGLPSWLLHAKQQGKTPIISSQPISITTSKQPQHISSRTNILNTPSVYHTAETASYSCNPGTPSQSQVNTSLSSASIALPPLVPVITAVKPASALNNTGFRNRMKVKERLKSKALGMKDLYPCKKTNKRLVAKAVDLVNPVRVLNLERHEMSNAMIRCTENLNGKMQCDVVTDDLSGAGYCYSTETRSDTMRSSGNESSRVDATGRSGPIKLSAGAKHILKPNQNMDLVDNFIPIHSTIPFSGPPTCVSRVPNESQKKATKIYRF